MNKIYPFKFLDAYTEQDSQIFFGREEEVKTLYEMAFQTDILLVYGASGTGKTSLIQCGLASQFRSYDWLPLSIRRVNNINQSLEKVLQVAAGGQLEESNNDLDLLAEVMGVENVSTAHQTRSLLVQSLKAIYLQHLRPIYLIFDQFEELYILGSKEEQTQFIQSVQEILNLEESIKLIFSIREEYLGHLYEFEKQIPQLLRKKLRVEAMNLDKVRQVVIGATSYEESNLSLQEGEENEIAELIFDKIKGKEKTLTIDLPYLQVFLDKLYLEITGDESRQTDAVISLGAVEQLGDIEDVLRAFLEEQVKFITQELKLNHSELVIDDIWQALSPLATLEGTKEPVSRQQIEDRLHHLKPQWIDDILRAFVKRRILRYSEEEEVYELAHDSLAQRIAEKRSDEEIILLEIQHLIKNQAFLNISARELFTEKQLNFMEPYLDKLQLEQEEKDLIEKSYQKLKQDKAAEEEELRREFAEAKAQAEKEQHLRSRAEESAQQARQRTRFAVAIAALALLAAVVAVYSLVEANKQKNRAQQATERTQETLDELLLVQRKAAAQKILNYAKNYEELGQMDYACENFQTVLDSLRYYPNDSLYLYTQRQMELRCKK